MKASDKVQVAVALWVLSLIFAFKENLYLTAFLYLVYILFLIRESYFHKWRKTSTYTLISVPILYLITFIDGNSNLNGSLRIAVGIPVLAIGTMLFMRIKKYTQSSHF
jgi:hypothetical protein